MSVGAVFGIVGGALSARQTTRRYAYTLLDKMTAFLGYVVLFLFFLNVLQLSEGTVTEENYVSFGSLLTMMGEYDTPDDVDQVVVGELLFDLAESLVDVPVIGEAIWLFGRVGNFLIDFFFILLKGLNYILTFLRWVFRNLLPAIFA